MEFAICTIGFAGKTAEEFFRLLQEAGVQKVIDIRENRGGQLSGFAKFPDIAFFLERLAGISYEYEPRFAPTPEIRKAYRTGRDWDLYEKSFLDLMQQRNIVKEIEPAVFARTFALLCSEPQPAKCHRRLVAELLSERLRSEGHTVEVKHLFSESSSKKRRPRSNDGAHPQ